MNKKFLAPSLAALLITSTVQATGPAADPVDDYTYDLAPIAAEAVTVPLDKVQYKPDFHSTNPPQIGLASSAPSAAVSLLGNQMSNPMALQSARTQLWAFHEHIDPTPFAPGHVSTGGFDGSPFEACRNYQMEQLGIALNQSHSSLKKYLKNYSEAFGGGVQVGTQVQSNPSSPYTLNQGLANPEFQIGNGPLGVGLFFWPVVELYNPLQNKPYQVSCKIISAQEINVMAASQLEILKAKNPPKVNDASSFKYNDLINEISASLQAVPRFGYPEHMDLQVQSYVNGQIKWDDVTPQNNPQTQGPVVAGTAN